VYKNDPCKILAIGTDHHVEFIPECFGTVTGTVCPDQEMISICSNFQAIFQVPYHLKLEPIGDIIFSGLPVHTLICWDGGVDRNGAYFAGFGKDHRRATSL
jgi:hypothetical protein